MKKRIILLLSPFLIIVILVVYYYLFERYSFDKQKISRYWISGIPCETPCWNNIYPGMTTEAEALAIINNFYDLQEFNNYPPENNLFGEITWISSSKEYARGSLYYSSDTKIISKVFVYYFDGFKFSDVIKQFGFPSYVLATSMRDYTKLNQYWYDISFIYPLKGFYIEYDRIYSPDIPAINSDMLFHRVIFFSSGMKGYEDAINSSKSLSYLETWKGFSIFQDYCHYISDENYRDNNCPKKND
jgi:hypothetical protein